MNPFKNLSKAIKSLIKALKDYSCKHKQVESALFPRAKETQIKGSRKKVIRWDVYKVYRCYSCKKVLREKKIKHSLTEKETIEYIEQNK